MSQLRLLLWGGDPEEGGGKAERGLLRALRSAVRVWGLESVVRTQAVLRPGSEADLTNTAESAQGLVLRASSAHRGCNKGPAAGGRQVGPGGDAQSTVNQTVLCV